ncbi:MAG: MFS transporter [Promethearchaeota archaeon]
MKKTSVHLESTTKQFQVITIIGFLRTFVGSIIGTGVPVFILVNWGSNLFSGLSLAAISVTYMFSAFILGNHSDKLGRRKSLTIALSGNLLVTLGLFSTLFMVGSVAGAAITTFMLVLRGMEGVFNGLFWPVLQSSISEISIRDTAASAAAAVSAGAASAGVVVPRSGGGKDAITRRGLSMYNFGWNGGILVGALSISLILFLDMLQLALVIPMIVTSINLLIQCLFFKEPFPDHHHKKEIEEKETGDSENHTHSLRDSKKVILFLGFGLIWTFSFQMGGLSTNTTNFLKYAGQEMWLGILDSIRLVFQIIGSSKVHLKGKNVQERLVIFALVIAFLMIPLGLFTIPMNIIPFFFIYPVIGLLLGILYAECLNLVASNATQAKRGKMMGLFEMSIGFGFFVGPTLAGFFTEVMTYLFSYIACGVIDSLLIITIYLIFFMKSRKLSSGKILNGKVA